VRSANRNALEFQFSAVQWAQSRGADGIVADACDVVTAFGVEPVKFEIAADALLVAKDFNPDSVTRLDIGSVQSFGNPGFSHIQIWLEGMIRLSG
jgi:hypothetical protein